jgi:hypothetical protein
MGLLFLFRFLRNLFAFSLLVYITYNILIMKKIILSSLSIILFTLVSCSNDEPAGINSISATNETTHVNSEITFTTINISGKVISNDGTEILSRGVCWSTNPNPTINENLINVENNYFTQTISTLIANTTYYLRIFAITANTIIYSENQTFSTLSLDDTIWEFSTYYSPNNFLIESTVNFYENGTTKFDEIGIGQGYFITYGTWSLNGNILTYRWNSTDPSNPEYLYTGTISGTTIIGTYTFSTSPGTWNAIQL